jgi:hypothetical protein
MVIQGSPHGGRGGGRSFNDATSLGLSSTAYCTGAKLFWELDNLIAIQFIYHQDDDIASEIYGGHGNPYMFNLSLFNETFMMHNGERINKVTCYVGTHKWLYLKTLIRYVLGIEFHTTAGRSSRLYGSNKGEAYTESYEGYTLGYAKGDSGFLVDMLQFVWYKQDK